MAAPPEEVEPEVDTCRVCSGPAEPNEPLFHPCKCSGSIRYIHQECLTTWLQHSKKKNCDVCQTQYAFKKVYDPNMPNHIPPFLFLRRVALQMVSWALLLLRGILVGTVWLVFLPYTTVWMWRFYFWTGEHMAWRAYGEARPHVNYTLTGNVSLGANSTSMQDQESEISQLSTLLHDLWSDIFVGQIIAALVVVLFLAVFLLREWIVQNARPGVFEDGVEGGILDDVDGLAPPLQAEGPIIVDEVVNPIPPPDQIPNQAVLRRRHRPAHREGRAHGRRRDQLPIVPLQGAVPRQHGPAGDYDHPPPLEQFLHADGPSNQDVTTPLARKFSDPEYEAPPVKRWRGESEFNAVDFSHTGFNPGKERETAELRTRTGIIEHDYDIMDDRDVPTETPGAGSSSGQSAPFEPPNSNFSFNVPRRAQPQSQSSSTIDLLGHSFDEGSSAQYGQMTGSRDGIAATDVDIPAWVAARGGEAFKFKVPANFSFGDTVNIPSGPGLAPRDKTASAPPGVSLTDFGPSSKRTRYTSRNDSWDSWNDNTAASTSFANLNSPNASLAMSGQESSSSSGLESSSDIPIAGPPFSRIRKPNMNASGFPEPALGPATQPMPSPSIASNSSAGPRRPHLPPTTPIDELPPPSPRPSHARASPLPTPTSAMGEAPIAGPSTLRDVTTAPDSKMAAIYRAPEELEAKVGYFTEMEVESNASDEAQRADLLDVLRRTEQEILDNDSDSQHDDDDDHIDDSDDDMPALENAQHRRNGANNAPPGEDEAVEDEGGENPVDMEGMDDDMDGALEAIGMRGPLHIIIQNASLMIFILDVTIGATVWLPFTLGKTLALNSMRPRRLLAGLHLPIRLVRLATDPVVDGILWFIRPAVSHGLRLMSEVLRLRLSVPRSTKTSINLNELIALVNRRVSQFVPAFLLGRTLPTQTLAAPRTAFWKAGLHYLTGHAPVLKPLETGAVALAGLIKAYGSSFVFQWQKLAMGSHPVDQAFAVFLGYAAVFSVAVLFMSSGLVFNGAVRMIRSVISQQLIVLKVAVFIIIELVVFPFGCGVILDLSTIPIFPYASIRSRTEYYSAAPVTMTFFHWMLGTMFMYQFAMLLAACRALMRKGAMWFIKDPQDPSFHPIRDILDRPALSQFRKLGISAIMYSFVIAGGVGSAIYYIRYCWSPFNGLLPLRWNLREPLTEIPVDLLFLHIIMPSTLDHFKPSKAIHSLAQVWWGFVSSELRLTSYMQGSDVPPETLYAEENASEWTWKALPFIRDLAFVAKDREGRVRVQDGSYARVPAGDTIALPEKARQLIVTTDQSGAPLDEAGRLLIEEQNAACVAAHREVEEDYEVVFLPPYFKYRVITFMLLLWLTCVSLSVTAVGAPIILGRRMIEAFTSRHMHDGYAFILGVYGFWGSMYAINGISVRFQQAKRRRQNALNSLEATPDDPNAQRRVVKSQWHYVLKRDAVKGLIWLSKTTWLMFAIGFILPLLLAVVMELYIILPVRIAMFPETEGETPTLRIWEDWALGLVLGKIAIRMQRMRPPNNFTHAIDLLSRNGWAKPSALVATRDLILPIGGGLLGMIVLPAVGPFLITHIFHINLPEQTFTRTAYPMIFVGACLAHVVRSAKVLIDKWAQTVRDKEFLVELRLQNLEVDGTQASPRVRAPGTT